MKKYNTIVTKKGYCYAAAFLLPLLVMIGIMVVLEVEPFGDHSFIIVDGLHQYMPFYSILYDKLKSGEGLFYTFRTGVGINFLSLLSYYLSSPFNLLILFFKKTQLNMAVSFLMVLKISLSGLTAAIYFGSKKKSSMPTLLIVAAAYALNSYMVGYSWNIMWMDAVMIFPLILLGIERIIEKGDGRLYTLTLFYALFCNYYIAFMICIFSVLWFLTCRFTSVRQFIISGISFALHSFLAAGMAAVLLIPAYLGIKETASGEDMSLPGHSWLTSFTDLLTRQIDLANPISHDNFDGNANLYFGIFVVMAFFLFLFHSRISLHKKITRLLLALFLLISCNEEILNFIWHGFHNQYGIPNRFSFMYGFVLIYMLYEVMTNWAGIELWHPPLAGLIILGFLGISWKYAGDPLEGSEYVVIITLLICYIAIFAAMAFLGKPKKWLLTVFAVFAVGEIIVSSALGFYNIGQISVSKFFSGTEDMEKAAQLVDDGSFYRSELAEGKIVDESAWYPLRGVSLFGSTAKHDMVKFMDSLGFYTGCNEYLYKGGNPVSNLLLGVRYLYYHEEDTLRSEFEYVDSVGEFDIFENPVGNLSLGYLMDEDIDEWYYESAYPFRVLNEMCMYGFGSDKIFNNIEIPEPETNGASVTQTNDGEYRFHYENSAEDNIFFRIKLTEDVPHLYMHYDGTQVEESKIEINGERINGGDIDGQILYLGSAKKDSEVTVSFQLKGEEMSGYVRLSMASFDQEAFDQMASKVTAEGYKIIAMSDDHIEGQIQSEKESRLVFSIPYDEGWTVSVDGKNAETSAVGNALLSVIIPEGQHEVDLTFVPPGYRIGWKISLCSVGIFILIQIYYIRRRKRIRNIGGRYE